MATLYIGIDRGKNAYEVTEGSSTTSSDFEIAIDDTNSPTKEEVIIAMRKLEDYIIRRDWGL